MKAFNWILRTNRLSTNAETLFASICYGIHFDVAHSKLYEKFTTYQEVVQFVAGLRFVVFTSLQLIVISCL